MPSIAQTLMNLPTRSKIVLGISALLIVGVLFFMLRLASAPSYTILASGMDPADAGKVTTALDEQGIGYELRANGTSVAVEKAQVGPARIALSSSGVSAGSGSQAGFELFDEQKLGASDFQQKVTYQRALEGEIARTVGQVDGVSGAQVQLVLPEDSLFADEETAATAAVMLSGDSGGLESGAVRGIAQLTASSVKGLKTENVTITDGSGQLLWPQDDSAGGGVSGGGKQAAQTRYERQLQASLDALLTQTLGPGKARVQVKADLDVDKTSVQQVTVDGKAVPEQETVETEKLKGAGSTAAAGPAGTGSNIPQYSAGSTGGGGSGSNYNRKSTTRKNLVPKSDREDGQGARRRQQPPGRPRRRQERPGRRLRGDPDRDQGRGRHRRGARRRLPGLAARVRQGARRAEGGPGAGQPARPAQVGRPRPGHARLHVLHEPSPQAPRGRGARLPELADRDRAAGVAGRARGAVAPQRAPDDDPPAA